MKSKKMRIGQGFDAHRLAVGRPLVLGGVAIPFDRGLEGHSDGDVLLHAVASALLGALGQGDLGTRWRLAATGCRGSTASWATQPWISISLRMCSGELVPPKPCARSTWQQRGRGSASC